MTDMTKSDIEEKVKSNTDTIETIISPSDLIHQDIENWEDADMDSLKDELSYNDWTYGIDHPYGTFIQELAMLYYREDMQRVPMGDLRFDSREKAVGEGYWLYDMSKYEVWDIINEVWEDIEYKHEYESEALMQVEAWVMDKYLENIQ